MVEKIIDYHIFIDPVTKVQLQIDENDSNKMIAGNYYYKVVDGVINFYNRFQFTESTSSVLKSSADIYPQEGLAPELRESHNNAFESAEESNGNIYGDLEDLPVVTQSGHFRRMELLSRLQLGNLEDKIAVDFGTGPWGFASVFPDLRSAGICIGFDVSEKALSLARKSTVEADNEKTIYATSDGEVIPLADDSVDVFFGGEVIEHVRSPTRFLQEIARVCKDGGTVILTTPNIDAFNYRIFQQPYCIGPEHISLMSYQEFKRYLKLFSRDVNILGYETSLSSTMDRELVDSRLLAQIQARAEKYPELSTGMISISKVCKVLYKKNKRELVLAERLWSSKTMVFSSANATPMSLFDMVDGCMLSDEMSIVIPVKGQHISLLFWGHNWSGIVSVTCGDVELLKDLYSEFGGFLRIDIPNEDLNGEVVVRHTGKLNDKSAADQVIFYKVIEYIDEATSAYAN